jgi:hypothetical protein
MLAMAFCISGDFPTAQRGFFRFHFCPFLVCNKQNKADWFGSPEALADALLDLTECSDAVEDVETAHSWLREIPDGDTCAGPGTGTESGGKIFKDVLR